MPDNIAPQVPQRSTRLRASLPGPRAAQGHLAMLGFSMLVAGSFVLGARAAPQIDPVALNALRFALAAAIIGALVWRAGLLQRHHLAAPWRYLVLGGLFGFYFVAMFQGLKTAAPVSAAAVFTLTPVMSAGFGYLLMRQITTPRMALALGIAAAGAVWVIFDGDAASVLRFDIGPGEAVYFVGCIAHALYVPMVPRLRRDEPVMVLTLGMLVAGALLLTAVGAPAIGATDWAALPPIVWITVGYLAVFASAMSFFLLQYAAIRLPSAKVMAYTYLTPVWVILGEGAIGAGWPPLAILAGIGLVLAGLVLLLKD